MQVYRRIGRQESTVSSMTKSKTATQAQMNTVFDYIHKYERYDMDISKLTAY